MIDITTDIVPLTDFNRHSAQLVKQMKVTHHPLVLTVNGKAEVVVLDARSYQQLLDEVERAQAIAGIHRGLEAFERKERRPARQGLDHIRRKHAIPG